MVNVAIYGHGTANLNFKSETLCGERIGRTSSIPALFPMAWVYRTSRKTTRTCHTRGVLHVDSEKIVHKLPYQYAVYLAPRPFVKEEMACQLHNVHFTGWQQQSNFRMSSHDNNCVYCKINGGL